MALIRVAEPWEFLMAPATTAALGKHFGSSSGSSSRQNVLRAPAPGKSASSVSSGSGSHILNTDPLKSIKFDPLQKKIVY